MSVNPRDKLRKFTGTLTTNDYNKFFNPNICHVCKSPNNGCLIPCDVCCMIFYCCIQHKEMHLESHLPICTSMTKILKDMKWNIATSFWALVPRTLIEIIQQNMGRNLEPYEIEMCMCAKSCFICHRQSDLQTCTICYSVNYCNDHKADVIAQHTSSCRDLLLLLNINIANIDNRLGDSCLKNRKFVTFPGKAPFHDMKMFIKGYIGAKFIHYKSIRNKSMRNKSKRVSWKMEYYLYSDYVSDPMTLYYALMESDSLHLLQDNDKFVIHLIAGSSADVDSSQAWELLMHIFRKINELYVVTIRPEVDPESGECYNLCYKCRLFKQKLYVENVSKPYHEYVDTASYKQPNIIIGFQIQLNVEGTRAVSLAAILARNCPLLLTAKSQNKADENINKIHEIVATTRNAPLSKENKFRSYKPYRDYKTGGIYYRNSYFTMYP